MKDIICDKEGCGVVIGRINGNDRPRYFEGTNQVGHNSYCSEEHLLSEWRRDDERGIYVKTS